MDLSLFALFVVFVVLAVYFLILYKPIKVEISEYMLVIPNRKIYLKWNEIEKIVEFNPNGNAQAGNINFHYTIDLNNGLEINYRYYLTPKKGKKIVFKLSQIKTPHPTLKINSKRELIKRKKEEYNI